MKQYVFEVLEEMSKQRNRKDKVRVLKENESWALKDIIRGSMDTTVAWNLPTGEPPYTAATAHSHPANLLRENVKFQYFVKGGAGDKMTKMKREQLFIGVLEGVHPEDAKLVISMINKEKIHGLSRPIVEEAFPDLLKD
tara:strand:+ start:201 stop:617 length:417 start_codon:yes stop_codon:yes gene_type:complete